MKTTISTIALSTAVALVLSVPALADDNYSNVIQRGDDNTAGVDQDGTGNETRILQGQPGNDGDRNTATVNQDGTYNLAGFEPYGDHEWTLRQYGHDNVIDIDQDGTSNEVGMDNGARYGTSSQVSYTDGVGVQQTGSQNILTVDQVNPGDIYSFTVLGAVRQTADIDATVTTNEIKVLQESALVPAAHGTYNLIGFIKQVNTGDGTVATDKNLVDIHQAGGGFGWLTGSRVYNVLQNGTANTVELDQTGDSNVIDVVTQLGTLNSATIDQDGNGNVVVSVNQDNTGGGSVGNTATLTFLGSLNGSGGFTAGPASGIGLTQATVTQLGDDNLLDYDVNGGSNLFAFAQVGDGNEIDGQVTGDNNQVAVAQNGADNMSFTQQNGANNNIGISQ